MTARSARSVVHAFVNHRSFRTEQFYLLCFCRYRTHLFGESYNRLSNQNESDTTKEY